MELIKIFSGKIKKIRKIIFYFDRFRMNNFQKINVKIIIWCDILYRNLIFTIFFFKT